ncbi:unnamed protein product (macronuclear) [Paramecium tetraurelia]|uniref:Uncharacterized protein n=1 Tax=Paramecium tetraurelia TaxID=5888 RepID=A0C6X4_PARTE|nr:uncharacterized protein GSPATT00035670001 [Paramecium tetraurelia]CAK66541.1 unnamed protein product [Paramecium tetraurelia]|eukprot:XP_001433938.1 hypothetical protein (macronuclear) [Paramecium tetraurelia strain d4-2]
MVYQWTNFVWETNAWWLRRIRPFIVLGGVAFTAFYGGRYYFFGKWAYYKQRQFSEAELVAQAEVNKRNWGIWSLVQTNIGEKQKEVVAGRIERQIQICYDMGRVVL